MSSKAARHARALILAAAVSFTTVLLLGAGCPEQTPVAEAGPPQTVAPGAVVTLDGSSSFDPAGASLTFQWAQTAGSPVSLSGANTAIATFIAPATPQMLAFQLTVSAGLNLTATTSAYVTVSTPPPVASTLIVANQGEVLTFVDPAGLDGDVPPSTNLSGSNTQLSFDLFLAVESANELIVSNGVGPAGPSLTVYAGALTVNGNLAPNRVVAGEATKLNSPRGLAYDKTRDVLYVANFSANNILVFTNVSTAGFNANLAPARVFSGGLSQPEGICLDVSGTTLYVASSLNSAIVVYANPSTLEGTVTPARTMTTQPLFNELSDVFLDNANDRLYAVNSLIPTAVYMFQNASTRNGVQTPDASLTIPGATALWSIAVDSTDRGYISDFGSNQIYSYDNISTRNGTVTPDRTISGPSTQLSSPGKLLVLE